MKRLVFLLTCVALICAIRVYSQSSKSIPAAPIRIIDPISYMWPRETNTVTLHCLIGKDGRVKRILTTDVSTLLRPAFDKAVGAWTFEPATLNGNPVESVVDIKFTYQLKALGSTCSAP